MVDRNKILRQADKLIAAGKIEAGIAQFLLLVQDNPRDLGTLNKVGDLYVKVNKKGEAIKHFTTIAEIYATDGFFLKAIAIYKKITKIDPARMEPIQRLAALYFKQGLKTEARAQYQALVQSLLKAGEPDKAIGIYESMVKADPDDVQAKLALAELKAKHGKAVEAADTFMSLGMELEEKGNAKESTRIYEMALKAGKGDPAVTEKLALTLVASGDHKKAAAMADKVLAETPTNAAMLEVKALSLMAEGQIKAAEAAAKKALESDPARPGAVICMARVLTGRDAFDEAAETISSGLDAIISAEKADLAVRALQEILSRAPSCRPALEVLYRIQAMVNDTAGIVFAGERLADVSASEGRFSEALAVARRLADLQPGNHAHAERIARIEAMSKGGQAPAAPAAPVVEEELSDADAEVEIGDMEDHDISDETAGMEAIDAGAAELPSDSAAYTEPELSPEDEEFITERLTEADVFVKYGLADRAIEQLNAIVERFPWHVVSRQRLRELHLEEGNRARAAIEAAALGRIALERGERGQAKAALDEARSIDAACPAIDELEALIAGAGPAASAHLRHAVTPDAEPEPGEVIIEEEAEFEEVAVEAEAAEEEIAEVPAVELEPEPAAGEPAAAAPSVAGVFDDLESELDAALFAAQGTGEEEDAIADLEASPEGHSLDEIVSAFKKGIEKQVDAEDFETHYNLGIAYKEMGLTEEAIAEFQFAAKDAKLMPSCCSMLGVCFKEKGMPSLAVKWYRKGLDALANGGDEELANGIRYDLAETLEQMGEFQQARDIFVEVYGNDSRYRDVAARVKALEERLGG